MAKKKVGVEKEPDVVEEVDRIATVATLALHDMELAEAMWDDLSIEEQRKVEKMLDNYFTQKLISGFVSELYGKPGQPDDDMIIYTIGEVPPVKKGKRSIKHSNPNSGKKPKESKKE